MAYPHWALAAYHCAHLRLVQPCHQFFQVGLAQASPGAGSPVDRLPGVRVLCQCLLTTGSTPRWLDWPTLGLDLRVSEPLVAGSRVRRSMLKSPGKQVRQLRVESRTFPLGRYFPCLGPESLGELGDDIIQVQTLQTGLLSGYQMCGHGVVHVFHCLWDQW